MFNLFSNSFALNNLYNANDRVIASSYSGQRDSVSMLKWITQFFPWKTRDLDPTILSKEVLSDRKLWVVDFSVPWCEPCRRMESQLTIVAQVS